MIVPRSAMGQLVALFILSSATLWLPSHAMSEKWIRFGTLMKHNGDASKVEDSEIRNGYSKCDTGEHECSPYAQCIGTSVSGL